MKKVVGFFNYFFIIIPLTMALVYSIIYFCGGWNSILPGHTPSFYFLEEITKPWSSLFFSLIWFIFILALAVLITRLFQSINSLHLQKALTFLAIVTVGFIVRFALIYLFRHELVPFSDFNRVWQLANGNYADNLRHYEMYPAYLNYSLYLRFIVKTFGSRYTYSLYFNALYSGLTAGFLYLICSEITSKSFVSALSGMIYALYLPNIVYSTVGTPEYLTILFDTAGLLTLICINKCTNKISKVLLATISGLLLGIGGSFKTFSIVIIIAFFMAEFFFCLLGKEGKKSKLLLSVLLMIVIVLIGYKCASTSITHITEQHYGIKLTGSSMMSHTLLVGLNTEGEGQIHIGTLGHEDEQLFEEGHSTRYVKSFAINALKQDWKLHPGKIVPNIGKKTIWAWQDDQRPICYFLTLEGLNSTRLTADSGIFRSTTYNFLQIYGSGVSEWIYFTIIMSTFIGALGMARCKELNWNYEILALIVFGFFSMLLLIEAQSRYKCLVMPYIICISGIGIDRIIKILKGHKRTTYITKHGRD